MTDFHINNLEFINKDFKSFPDKIKIIFLYLYEKLNELKSGINFMKLIPDKREDIKII